MITFFTIIITAFLTILLQRAHKKVVAFFRQENILQYLKKEFAFTYDVISREQAAKFLQGEHNETST